LPESVVLARPTGDKPFRLFSVGGAIFAPIYIHTFLLGPFFYTYISRLSLFVICQVFPSLTKRNTYIAQELGVLEGCFEIQKEKKATGSKRVKSAELPYDNDSS
jgi:hypothetical protein